MIKSTYSLDLDTTRAIGELAARWGVSKSEVLRRAVQAAVGELPRELEALAALDELQQRLGLSEQAANRWANRARGERRESSVRSESGR